MRITFGIEEEFQILTKLGVELVSGILEVLRTHEKYQESVDAVMMQLKAELMQTIVEMVSDIYDDINTAYVQHRLLHQTLLHLTGTSGYKVISSGTHPNGSWQTQKVMEGLRYAKITGKLQDLALIGGSCGGLHLHYGLQDEVAGTELDEAVIALMDIWQSWHAMLFRAFASNSPIWEGRLTGLKSYRSVLWKNVPRSRAPQLFGTAQAYSQYIQTLLDTGVIDEPTKIWWDARRHPIYKTLEIRSMDMPGTLRAVFDLAAMGQAIVAWQAWLWNNKRLPHPHPYAFWDENNIEVVREGLDAMIIDFATGERLRVREAIDRELQATEPILDDLGSKQRIHAIRNQLATMQTGADLQIRCYLESLGGQGLQLTTDHETRSNQTAINAVIHLLVDLAKQDL